jgi:hypothetical protein
LEEPENFFHVFTAVGIAEISEMDYALTTMTHEDVDCFFGDIEVSMAV